MHQKPVTGSDELGRFLDRSTASFDALIKKLIGHILNPKRDYEARQKTVAKLGELLASTMGSSDMAGRRRVLLEMDYRKRIHGIPVKYEIPTVVNPIVPNVAFDEALVDMATRDPRLARGAAEVSRLYTVEHGFAMARSVDLTVTKRCQDYVSQFLREGGNPPAYTEQINELGSWGRAYSETVFRTNVATAYSNGRWQQAQDPDLADFVVGMKREPVGDADTRPNHNFTLIARMDDPIWGSLSAPAGYNCRCDISPYDVLEARRDKMLVNGRLPDAVRPPGAYNDPGFDRKNILGGGLWSI